MADSELDLEHLHVTDFLFQRPLSSRVSSSLCAPESPLSAHTQAGLPTMDSETKTMRARSRALAQKANLTKERADGHQSLLRDLYHLMTQTSGLSAPTASIRAGDETPELQSFLHEYGLTNPEHKQIHNINFSPALADLSEEEVDVKPILPSTPAPPPRANTTPLPKQPEASSSRPSPRAQSPTVPSRKQRLTPARSFIEHPKAPSAASTTASPTTPRFDRMTNADHLATTSLAPSPADTVMPIDLSDWEEEPPAPPRITINPALLLTTPMIHLPLHYEHSFTSEVEPKDPITEPLPVSDLSPDPALPPLVSDYAASLYPLPPEQHPKKRKTGNRRHTVSGTPVVDLDRWEATMNVNPATRLARKSSKCLSTREWEIMYHEVRYLKALQKIQELKMAGRWSFRQPKKQRGPIVYKTHWDYLIEEMKWLQTDYKEERKWKIAVAMDLAYAAAEYVNADHDRRKLLTRRMPRLIEEPYDEDAQEEDLIDSEVLEGGDAPPLAKRRRLSPRPDEMEVDPSEDNEITTTTANKEPVLRKRRRIAKLSQPVAEEDEDEDDDEDDDDRASVHSAIRDMSIVVVNPSTSAPADPPPVPTPNPADIVIDLERAKEEPDQPSQFVDITIDLTSDTPQQHQSLQASSVPSPTGPAPAATGGAGVGDAKGEEQDMDIDAEGEADDENGTASRSRSASRPAADASSSLLSSQQQQQRNIQVKVEPKALPGIITMTPAPKDETASRSESLTAPSSGLKSGREDISFSSTAGSLLDPKLLRGPILDLSWEETAIDLSDLFNRGLALEDREPDCDKDDISFQSLFPELSVYEFGAPPELGIDPINGNNDNNKRDKRVDESGMSVGRLTYTNRLMDSKNVLLSTLQPGVKYRKGVWDDPSDLPITIEPRDYSKVCPDPPPPSAPMFAGLTRGERPHLSHCILPTEPHDSEARSILFVWTPEEDQQIKTIHNQFGPNWQLISDIFNSSRITIATDVRGAWDCYKRWRTLMGEDKPSTPGDSAVLASPSTVAITRREAANKAAQSAPQRKVTLQVAAARAAGGRRPMRHSIIFEVIKRLMNKRAQKIPVKPRTPQTVHDTHIQFASQQKHLTPAELTRLKFERDQHAANQQMAQVQIQRRAEAARQMNARNAQMQQLPNIAQQQRMPMPPAPQSAIGAGQNPPQQRPQLTPAQQQSALLQFQQRAQQLQNPQMFAQAQAALAAHNAATAQAAVQAAQNGQGPSSSPVPQNASPHPGAATVPGGAPNGVRPPSSGGPVPGSTPMGPMGVAQAQVQAAALAYNRAAAANAVANAGNPMPGAGNPGAGPTMPGQVLPTSEAAKNAMLQQMIWQRQAAQSQLVAQQHQAAAANANAQNQTSPQLGSTPHLSSSSPHLPPNPSPST